MSTSSEQLSRDLLSNGIVSAGDFQQAVKSAMTIAGQLTNETLYNSLLSHGMLTPYQVETLRSGKLSELVFGNYIVLDKLGTGGMGTVYKARHRRMKRVVAIKVLSRELTKSADMVARFQQEVETTAQLSHPNIVTAHDADECDLGHFLVMEYVAGSDLAVLVKKNGPLPVRDAVDCVVQTARALEYAHGQKIIHRDIKPANLLRNSEGTVKVTDLGLAAFKGTVEQVSDDTYAAPTVVVGTVDFMPPEQAFNPDAVDHRADIYSLACTLYFLLTGQHMYGGESIMSKLLAHRDRPVPSMREWRPDVPPNLDSVFRRMAAKLATDRQRSMTEVISALEECELRESADTSAFFLPSGVAIAEPAATSLHLVDSITMIDLSVVLVEPSRLQARMIGGQLQELGVQRIQMVNSGQAALELMLAARPELVISAMHLPDMTGADLVHKMRIHPDLSEIAFVLISSETDHQFLDPVRQSGTAAILPKPFELEALKRALTVSADFFSRDAVRAHNLNAAAIHAMIVDDSRSARRHVRRVLENLGIRAIIEAADGQQAMDLLASNTFNLVITDYNMPGIDGPTLIRHIRKNPTHQAVPILMITSESDPALLDKARAAGATAICDKVFDPKTVCGILDKILAKRS